MTRGRAFPPAPQLTWVLAAAAPLDEADDEQDQHQKGDGTHEPDEPALGSDVCLVIGVRWQGGWEANHEPLIAWGAGEDKGRGGTQLLGRFVLAPVATA